MNPEIDIIVKPSLRTSSEKIIGMLDRSCEAVFLPLPKSLDELVVELVLGLGYEDFVKEVRQRGILPEPVEGWLKANKPILENIKRIGKKMVTYCYKDSKIFYEECNTSLELSLLSLRDSLRNKPDVGKWLEILSNERRLKQEALQRDAEILSDEACVYSRSTCIAGFEGRHIMKMLPPKFKTNLRYVDLPYHFTPLDILRREISRGDISEERAEELIRAHLRYLREYVIPYGLDTAQELWNRENLYWHPAFSRDRYT
ncbi:hypothetical protein HRbin01_00932 [archaeon HR01]|nr:hypothetical protein HRbin01_00932 [archaeon HR01]